jgi:hypothetical protein
VADNFHQQYENEIPLPSDRSTGLVFAGVALVVALIFRNDLTVVGIAVGIAILLALVSFLAAHILHPLNIAWFRFAMLLNKIVNPIVMFTLFAVTIVPFGLVMQFWYDPLRKRRGDASSSYWIERTKTGPPSSMSNQF